MTLFYSGDDYEPPSKWENLKLALLIIFVSGWFVFLVWWFNKGIFN